ncbi:hypothetical protein [Microtetraspora malaysiensis]|uniref:FtsX-like permease family protein n=1 Tax=Microtetraspora malaysiensis TaxID=161358 RepID=A0ABW6SQB2_9ACTN
MTMTDWVLSVIFAIPLAFICGSVAWAASSAPRDRRSPVSRRHLARGAGLCVAGTVVMALTALATREDVHYDDFGSVMTILAGMLGGLILLLGLGPFVPWQLRAAERHTVRLPGPLRLTAHRLSDRRGRTAAGVAITLTGTAVTVATMIIASGVTATDRAGYVPQARSGALRVEIFTAERGPAARAALQRELPAVPLIDRYRANGLLYVDVPGPYRDYRTHIGDQVLLRYLTADPATPYDEGTAVVITSDDIGATSVQLRYSPTVTHSSLTEKVFPAITVKAPGPGVEGVFVPAKAIQNLGLRPEPDEFIVDPSLHRTSPAEQERISDRLGDDATVYVERGFQAPTGWIPFAAATALLALGGALVATWPAPSGSRSRRVLLRVGARSCSSARRLITSRTAFLAACGTVPGVAAGCLIGLTLVWPMTAPFDWDPAPRPDFVVPWPPIAALAAGLPMLTVLITAFASPGRGSPDMRAAPRLPIGAEPKPGDRDATT